MRNNYIAGMALVLLLVSHSVVAKASGATVGVQAGTLGAGVALTTHLSEEFSLRGGVNSLNFDFDTNLGGVDYTMEPDFKNVSLLLDYRPFRGVFRLTGGLYLADHAVGWGRNNAQGCCSFGE